jgi:hypothetical protein
MVFDLLKGVFEMIKLSTCLRSLILAPNMDLNLVRYNFAGIKAYPSERKDSFALVILGIAILVSCIISFFIIKTKKGKSSGK